MVRIFLVLALFSLALLAANIVWGFSAGDYNQAAQRYRSALREVEKMEKSRQASAEELESAQRELQDAAAIFEQARQRQTLHFMLGVAAALAAVLVNSLSVTYFIGTARWCKEVGETYQLDDELTQKSQQLKRRTFPWSALGILSILTIVFSGAAADPGSSLASSQKWVAPHYIVSLIGSAIVGWSFWIQVGAIGKNYEIIEQIMNEVRRIRAEKGLDQEVNLNA